MLCYIYERATDGQIISPAGMAIRSVSAQFIILKPTKEINMIILLERLNFDSSVGRASD